jgi:DnaJ-class molecular chaperone
LQPAEINHYGALGLERDCTAAQIRAAYRILAKQYHPDLNPGSPTAVKQTQAISVAYAILSDTSRRAAYDSELAAIKKTSVPARGGKSPHNFAQDVNVRIEELLRGTTREVRVHDPSHPDGPEIYELVIPANTAPGTRFRLARAEPFAGGFVQLRVRVLPGFRFKARGSDLRCDLRIRPQRAAQGGVEMIPGAAGSLLRIQIPRGVARGEIVRIPGEGLPKPRGGRGDLLVRILYRPEVRVSSRARR